ncbi:beta-propeller fold lactonase family protein [Vibrio casei]|uniref:6-phosphogluconolactonase n=1 Tax=Vibrio casei TaxID=673372 RepID=A0A368LL14_9VIBR|nr:6-phosphogluconolactonase [Vibrio casei]
MVVAVVYVSCPNSCQLHVLRMGIDGVFDVLQIVETPGEVQPITISHDQSFLYATVRPEFALLSYKIESDGKLTEIGRSSMPVSASSSCIDITGQYLLLSSYAQNALSVSHINSHGIAQSPHQVLEHLTKAHSVMAVADQYPIKSNSILEQQTIFCACLGDDKINLYRFNHNGYLIKGAQSKLMTKMGSGPRHMTQDASGKNIYAINELDGDVLHFVQDEKPRWQLTQTLSYMPVDFAGPFWAADIHITKDARFLYVSERTSSTLALFSIDSLSGELTLIELLDTELAPRGFALSPDNIWLVCAGQHSNHVASYQVDNESGKLTIAHRHSVGDEPMWVRIITR